MEGSTIAIYIGVFILSVCITRLIFSIPTIVRNLRVQTQLLTIIAKKLEANPEEVHNTLQGLVGPFDSLTKDLSKLDNHEGIGV